MLGNYTPPAPIAANPICVCDRDDAYTYPTESVRTTRGRTFAIGECQRCGAIYAVSR